MFAEVFKILVNRIEPKNTVEGIKHLKIQHLFENPKKYASHDQYPKNTDFQNSKPKKILR